MRRFAGRAPGWKSGRLGLGASYRRNGNRCANRDQIPFGVVEPCAFELTERRYTVFCLEPRDVILFELHPAASQIAEGRVGILYLQGQLGVGSRRRTAALKQQEPGAVGKFVDRAS